jgi:hypothetical protein
MIAEIPGLAPLLKAEGFARRKNAWNRTAGEFVDVVELQRAKSGADCFVNVGVCSPIVAEICWSRSPRGSNGFIDEGLCTVRMRLGTPPLGGPAPWPFDAAQDSDFRIRDHFTGVVLPLLKQLHSMERLADALRESNAETSRYPPPAIYLATIAYLGGAVDEAHRILRTVHDRTFSEPWKKRIVEVEARLRALARS